MSKIRIVALSFFAFALAFSPVGFNPALAKAEDSTSTPVLKNANVENTGGSSAIEAGDSIVLEFSESTNKFAITASNIASVFSLNNSHSFLDGAGALGSATWSDDGEELTIILSSTTSLPTVNVGDEITLLGTSIKDTDNNAFGGSTIIGGSFTSIDYDEDEECTINHNPTPTPSVTPTPSPTVTPTPSPTPSPTQSLNATRQGSEDEQSTNSGRSSGDLRRQSPTPTHIDDDEDSDCDHNKGEGKYRCGTGLQNGSLYKLTGSPTVYLLAGCRFKPFRGQAAFHSRGLKFQDIQEMAAFPVGMIITDEPVVPAEGTLIKGSDKTVWFVDKSGKRRGFTSEQVFKGLGFSFERVDQIEDTDLMTVSVDTPINTDANHPDGSLVKCGNSTAVFTVIGNMRFPFANAEAFKNRGHRFDHILMVDCGRFAYREGAAITE